MRKYIHKLEKVAEYEYQEKHRKEIGMQTSTQKMAVVIGIVAALGFSMDSWSQTNHEGQATLATNELGTIVVTGTRIPHALNDVGVSASVISKERIEEMKAQNVGEALRESAGARVNSYGAMGAGSSISLRGSTANQVLVMVDGRPVNLPSVGSADLSMYPVDQIERIEVIRGPASVLYGANALAGVVNIVTKDVPDKLLTEASASYGTFDTRIFRLSNGAKIGDLGYLITASQNSSDGYRTNSACDGYHVSGKVNYDLSQDSRLIFSTGYSRQDKGIPGAIIWPSPNCTQDDERYWFDATHKVEFGKNSCLTSKVFLNQHWQEYKDTDLFTDDISRNQQLGLDVQQTLPLGDRHLLLGGIFFERDNVNIINDITGGSRIGGKQNLTTTAIYLQDEISLSESLIVTPGLRCDVQSEYGTEVSPKVSGLYRFTDKTSLRASVGRGFRAPTIDDLYWRDDYSAGNPDLKPEKSIGYDVGIQHEFGSKNLFQVTLFRSEVENLITWADTQGNGIWEACNIDKACLQGVETEVNLQCTKQVSIKLSYTFLDARDTGEEYHNQYLRYKPKHKGGCRLQYQGERGLKVNLGAEYTDSAYSDRANTSEVDGFVLVDTSVSQTVGKGTEIFVSGKNLLDQEYEVIKGYPMPGTIVMSGVKVIF
ncbi:MAG: hypothetical protein A2283_12585 [Lentisphaerae bacterium RIFOXYA12_FULL_48_11]|nr:MAG: hypothetical protein A2283_12585 [Lentisphaerae bacterium RIFOXYA12_FULL_48_11]